MTQINFTEDSISKQKIKTVCRRYTSIIIHNRCKNITLNSFSKLDNYAKTPCDRLDDFKFSHLCAKNRKN
jgi:hypothetical protein